MKKEDSKAYLDKKSFFEKILTIYGRNAVKEALENRELCIYKLHLSKSNKDADVLEYMKKEAKKREVEIVYHTKEALSRISKNAKQDQGVALDIVLEKFEDEVSFVSKNSAYRIIALDGVTNPQNLGMIIRSCVAGEIDAMILPTTKTAQITPLVIKASVGTLFKMPIIHTKNLAKTLHYFQKDKATIYTLSSNATTSYKEAQFTNKTIFVLGNESSGVSKEIEGLSNNQLIIPMKRGVDSLNVAMTSAILAFM